MTEPAEATPAASCRDLVKLYRTQTSVVRALNRVSLDIAQKSIVAVFGPSGSGKSSLARILAAIDLPDGGSVEVGGTALGNLGARARRRLRRKRIGYVCADPQHNLLAYLDAEEHIELAVRMRGVKQPRSTHKEILEILGLGHRLHHRPAQLSGGEQQRLSVAAAVSGRPALVVLDEPTAELDRSSAETLLEQIAVLRSRGSTFVISSHDPSVAEMADEVVRLTRGSRVA